MEIGKGYQVKPVELDDIGAAAAQVGEGVRAVAGDVAAASELESMSEDWRIGAKDSQVSPRWDDCLHAFAADVQVLGERINKASKLYQGAEERFTGLFRSQFR